MPHWPGRLAVGVVDVVGVVRAAAVRGPQHQQLVAADAGAPARQPAALLGGQVRDGFPAVDDYEIVAEAVHLGEIEAHGGILLPGGNRAENRSGFNLGI